MPNLFVLFASFSVVPITCSLGFVLAPNFTQCRRNPGHKSLKLEVMEQELPQELWWERKGRCQFTWAGVNISWKNSAGVESSGKSAGKCSVFIINLLCCEHVLKRFNLDVYGRDIFPSGICTVLVPIFLWNSPFVLHRASSIYKYPKYGIVLFFIWPLGTRRGGKRRREGCNFKEHLIHKMKWGLWFPEIACMACETTTPLDSPILLF